MRYQGEVLRIYFRADAGFANPEVYDYLEGEGIKYAIRFPANRVCRNASAICSNALFAAPPLMSGVPIRTLPIRREAGEPRRVVAKVEWHPGELYPRVGSVVTDVARPAENVVGFYNKRGTCEQWIKEGKGAIRWTRLSCRSFAANAVRLQLHALAYNLGRAPRMLMQTTEFIAKRSNKSNSPTAYAWEVEHHFLEECSHSSAPEVFLAACSQRTERIRLGHGIVLMPPGYNHPARVAERIAALDLVSDGRVDFGAENRRRSSDREAVGSTSPRSEQRGGRSVEQCLNMMVMTPYPGYEGSIFSMPCRNVVPKPLQKPHPPVWVACSNRGTVELAARLGIRALTFAFVDPTEAKQWVDDYYRILKTECVPIGHAVNANIAMVTGFSVHADAEEAKRRGEDGFKFFGYALAHHYIFGEHKPGRTDIWAAYEKARATLPEAGAARGIGTPEQLRRHLASFEESGVDQVPSSKAVRPARPSLPVARTIRTRGAT